MSNLWLKIKVWTKLIVLALALIYVAFFIMKNSEKQATLWFWFGRGNDVTTSVLKLVAITFFIGILVAVLTRTTLRTIRQIQDLRGRQAAERRERELGRRDKKLSEIESKASMLRARPAGSADATADVAETGDVVADEPAKGVDE
jgi:hypothetical protein